MAAGVRRVTVVGSARRLDLAVPAAAPVAELLPDVVSLAGEAADGVALPRWALTRMGAGDLSPGTSLAEAGVPDGAVLYLRRVDEPVVGLQGTDLVERAATPVAGGVAADRVVLAAGASGGLALLAWLLLRDGRPAAALVAAALALAAAAGGRWMSTRNGDGTERAGALVALAAVPLGACAAVLATRSTAPVEAAAALLGAGAGALLAALAGRAARPAAGAVAGLATAAAAGVLLSLVVTRSQAAAVTAVAGVLLVPLLPRLVLRLHGLRLSDLARAGSATERQLQDARRALPWATAADGVLVAVAAGVVARSARGAELWLTAVCGLLLVLRSREGGRTGLPLAVLGSLTLLLTVAGLALAEPRSAGPLAVLGGAAAVCAAAAVVPESAVDRPRWAQRRRRLEALALVALVPLLAAVLGVFGEVVELARGVE